MPFALRRGWRRPGACADATRARLRASAWSLFGAVGIRRLLVPEPRAAAHDDVELGVHHRVVRRVHAAHRDRRDTPPARARTSWSRSRCRSFGLFLLEGGTLQLGAGDALTLGCAFMFGVWIFVGGVALAALRPDRAHGRRSSSCSRCSRSRSSRRRLGPHHDAGRRRGRSSPGSLCSAVAFTLQLWGQRFVEPSRAAVILLFEPVVAGHRRLRGRRAARACRVRRRARDPGRDRHRRVPSWRVVTAALTDRSSDG